MELILKIEVLMWAFDSKKKGKKKFIINRTCHLRCALRNWQLVNDCQPEMTVRCEMAENTHNLV